MILAVEWGLGFGMLGLVALALAACSLVDRVERKWKARR